MAPVRRSSTRRRPPARAAAGASTGDAARFAVLLELAGDWYWETDPALRFSTMQPKAGLRLSLPPLGCVPWEAGGLCAPGQLEALRRAMQARLPFDAFEVARPDAAGRLRHGLVSGRPVHADDGRFLGYRGIGRDVTAQRDAEQALNASESQLAAVIDAAMDAIVTVDADGRVVLFNQAASDMFGCSRTQALGASLATWLPQAQSFIQASQSRRTSFGPLVRGLALEARQGAQGLHLLRLPQLGLERLAGLLDGHRPGQVAGREAVEPVALDLDARDGGFGVEGFAAVAPAL
ncbi:MAG: PAS domain S-box protein, partial [Comamonadaceae bacterium]